MAKKKSEVKSNFVDRAVSFFDPVKGAQRLRARSFMSVLGGYHGGSTSRRAMAGWKTFGNDADADTLVDTPLLRERSRDLVRNDPLACGALNTTVTSVIGGTGLVNQSRINAEVLGITEDEATEWEKKTDMEFQLWAKSEECDIERTLRFPEIQELVYRQVWENGDVFITMPFVKRPGSPYGLKLQIIEADRVTNPKGTKETSMFAGGVEKDKNGAPVKYHAMQGHPGSISQQQNMKWDAIPVFGPKTGRRNVLHLYKKLRPGQSRGVPELAPVMESLKQLSRYQEAELMAAVVAGMFTVFIETESGDDGFFEGDQTTGGTSDDEGMKLANGSIVGLAKGEKITTANPNRPNANFDPFVMSILKYVGAALGMPVEILLKNFTSSYSASRAAMLEAWRFFMARRLWMARNFCQPVYETWLMEAVANGRVIAPGFLSGDPMIRAAYCGCDWIGPARGMIDENKEMDASKKKIELGLSTIQRESAELTGSNWLQNHNQHKTEVAKRKEDGITESVNAEPADSVANQIEDIKGDKI